jgi:hypothetical protein
MIKIAQAPGNELKVMIVIDYVVLPISFHDDISDVIDINYQNFLPTLLEIVSCKEN